MGQIVPAKQSAKSKNGYGVSRVAVGAVATQRDREVLAMVGNHYGASYWLLSYWLSSVNGMPLSESGVRQQVQRWLALGLVTKGRRLGQMWVTPTRQGYAFAAQSYSLWLMPATRLNHTEVVGAVRVWYESSPERVTAQGVWRSERQLYAARAKERPASWHVSDAELVRPDCTVSAAIEVELHRKQPASRYVDEVLTRLRPDVDALVYLCPKDLVPSVRQSLEWAARQVDLESRLSLSVSALPTLAQGRVDRHRS